MTAQVCSMPGRNPRLARPCSLLGALRTAIPEGQRAIRELAEAVARILGYPGTSHWDATQPDGTPRKLMDTTRLNSLGWSPKIPLEEGIRGAYQDFLKQT